MSNLLDIQFVHNNIARCGNVIFNKDFLHQFLVGNEFSSCIIDVPRKPKFFCHLSNDQKNLICTHGNGEINLFLLGNLFYAFDIKDIYLIELIGIFFRSRDIESLSAFVICLLRKRDMEGSRKRKRRLRSFSVASLRFCP